MTARKKVNPLPGAITTQKRNDGTGWSWRWLSNKGNVHFHPGPFPTTTAARAAARKWVRDKILREAPGDDE